MNERADGGFPLVSSSSYARKEREAYTYTDKAQMGNVFWYTCRQ